MRMRMMTMRSEMWSCLLSGASMDWEGRGDGRGGRLAVSGSGFGAESPLRAARSGRMHSL